MMSSFTRKELTALIKKQSQDIARLEHTVRTLDAGLFVAIYSLLHEQKIFMPEFIKTNQDIMDAKVHEVISGMMEIIKGVNNGQNNTKKTD